MAISTDIINSQGSQMNRFMDRLLLEMGIGIEYAVYIELILNGAILFLICYIANYFTKKVILRTVIAITKKSKNQWDDVLVEERVFSSLSHIVPAIILEFTYVFLFKYFEFLTPYMGRMITVYIEVVVAITVLNFINAIAHISGKSKLFKDKPVDSFQQLARIIVFIVLGILLVSELMGVHPGTILTAMGAMTVVIMLIFKDTILGFVASIQISSNNMLKVGDWIVFEKFGADGTVMMVNLTTVKIQNWDKTISTIPTYSFISEGFINWRGMEESGGRRIKRSILIDMTSVKFLDEKLRSKLLSFHYLAPYLKKKEIELSKHNEDHKVNLVEKVNGRNLTNLGSFRAYLGNYLRDNKMVNQEMTFLVRQLDPTENGLPIEIYVFSKDQEWANYEAIQSDIFDHVIAIIPEFDLKIFQNPTGFDFKSIVPEK
jgi:miniconductance mechanosensitive channel